jgi:hypothetical protein
VRDHRAARHFLRDWVDFIESEENADFYRSEYRGFETWNDANNARAHALSDEILVIATVEVRTKSDKGESTDSGGLLDRGVRLVTAPAQVFG